MSPVGFGFQVVASAASLARLLARSLARLLARSLAKPYKKTDQFHFALSPSLFSLAFVSSWWREFPFLLKVGMKN